MAAQGAALPPLRAEPSLMDPQIGRASCSYSLRSISETVTRKNNRYTTEKGENTINLCGNTDHITAD